MAAIQEWLTGETTNGRLLPLDLCNQYRQRRNLPPLQRSTVQSGSPENQWNPDMPSRGLGDSVAKFTHATGLDKVAETVAKAVGKKNCGCHGDKGRQGTLNRLVPYESSGESGPS